MMSCSSPVGDAGQTAAGRRIAASSAAASRRLPRPGDADRPKRLPQGDAAVGQAVRPQPRDFQVADLQELRGVQVLDDHAEVLGLYLVVVGPREDFYLAPLPDRADGGEDPEGLPLRV